MLICSSSRRTLLHFVMDVGTSARVFKSIRSDLEIRNQISKGEN